MSISKDQIMETKINIVQMITQLGLSADIKAKSKNDFIQINIATEEPGRLIGRNGQHLNALQHLLNTILLKKNKTFPKVMIDVEGYYENKKKQNSKPKSSPSEKIKEQALNAAKEVKKWGEEVVLAPLDAEECKTMELILKEDPEIEVSLNGQSRNSNKQRLVVRLKRK